MHVVSHLRRDGDEPGRSLPWLVRRQLRECAADLGRARAVTTAGQFPHVAARLLSYHLSHAMGPMASRRRLTMGVTVNGRRLRLTLRRNTSDLHVYREIFLSHALRDLADERLARARTVVDLGSNIGLASAYLACWSPNATFYCADPAEDNNEVARQTFTANGIEAVVDTLAVAAVDGSIEFYQNEWWASSSTVKSVSDSRTSRSERFESSLSRPPVTVPAVTVGGFLSRHGLSSVDLMKIDIEGAEEEVMRGDTDWLDMVDTVAIEIHRKYIDAEPVLAALRRHGMRHRDSAGPLDLFSR